mmetsp:Transcript_40240/g.106559  ORF Transcript_40240/g.106559 Transcript_40240/m.106559 type:complete len:252 (+) Transcript_40240:208-963(+)
MLGTTLTCEVNSKSPGGSTGQPRPLCCFCSHTTSTKNAAHRPPEGGDLAPTYTPLPGVFSWSVSFDQKTLRLVHTPWAPKPQGVHLPSAPQPAWLTMRKSRRSLLHVVACQRCTALSEAAAGPAPEGPVGNTLTVIAPVAGSVVCSKLGNAALASNPWSISEFRYVAMLGTISRMPVASECSAFGTIRKCFGPGMSSHHQCVSSGRKNSSIPLLMISFDIFRCSEYQYGSTIFMSANVFGWSMQAVTLSAV